MLQVVAAVALGASSIHEYVTTQIVHGGNMPLREAQNITQKRDHFNEHDTATWQMRYWVDETYLIDGKVQPDTPVFLSMGGEGASGPPGGQMAELAQTHHALLASIEHRYFGDSIPTKDFSTDNFQWLGTEQVRASLLMCPKLSVHT